MTRCRSPTCPWVPGVAAVLAVPVSRSAEVAEVPPPVATQVVWAAAAAVAEVARPEAVDRKTAPHPPDIAAAAAAAAEAGRQRDEDGEVESVVDR